MDNHRPHPPAPFPQYPAEDVPRPTAPVAPPPYPVSGYASPYPVPSDPDYDERYKRAKKRVEEVKGFYSHLTTFVGVMALLLAINFLTGPRYLWVVWPLLGWGFGLIAHAWGIFGPSRLLGKEWEARRIQEEMRRRP